MNTIKNEKAQEWMLAIILFFMTNPCFVWFTPIPVISTLLFYLIAIVFREVVHPIYVLGYLLFTFFYILVGLRYGFSLSLIYTFAIPLILLMDKPFLCKGFNKFVQILSITLTLSLIVYIMVVLIGISMPHVSINPLNPLRNDTGKGYEMYPFLLIATYSEFRGDILQRFSGMYDEAGVVGTMNAIILVANNYKLKEIKYIPIFLTGLFSFSLYFFVITIFYYIVTMKKSNVLTYLFFASIILYAISFIPGIDYLVYDRFLIEDGVWKGNSRDAGDYAQWFSRFRDTSDYYFGLGPGANLVHNPGGASYKDVIVNYGVIMFSIYIFSWLVFIIRTQKGIINIAIVSMTIMGCIFQRPFITDVFMQLSFLYLLFNTRVKFLPKRTSKLYELSGSK